MEARPATDRGGSAAPPSIDSCPQLFEHELWRGCRSGQLVVTQSLVQLPEGCALDEACLI